MRTYRIIGLALLGLSAIIVGLALAGCSPSQPGKSREQVWIENHPTHQDLFGRCVEFDGELCDDDPFDLDDLTEVGKVKKPSAKPSAKPSVKPKPAPSPAPRPKTTRR